jgi:hypothetical protein
MICPLCDLNSLSMWLWLQYLYIFHLFSYDYDDDVELGTMEKEVPMSQIWSVAFPFVLAVKKPHFLYMILAFIQCKKMIMTNNLFWRIPRLCASVIINYSLTGGNWTVFWTPITNFHLLNIWNYWIKQNFHVFSQGDTKICYTTIRNQP